MHVSTRDSLKAVERKKNIYIYIHISNYIYIYTYMYHDITAIRMCSTRCTALDRGASVRLYWIRRDFSGYHRKIWLNQKTDPFHLYKGLTFTTKLHYMNIHHVGEGLILTLDFPQVWYHCCILFQPQLCRDK